MWPGQRFVVVVHPANRNFYLVLANPTLTLTQAHSIPTGAGTEDAQGMLPQQNIYFIDELSGIIKCEKKQKRESYV